MFSEEILVDGCAVCGRERKTHGFVHTRGYGSHYGIEPTNAQRLERMRRRRAMRLGGE